MPRPRPFTLKISDRHISDLKHRLSLARFPEKETVDDWSQGVPLNHIREVAHYWQNRYDMARLERRLNGVPQFLIPIDGLEIHFIHVRSAEPEARPLLLSHGWPGSVVEFLKVIAPLTDPRNHGGKPEDAFHVVCPSLPGFGFSEKPSSTGWNATRIADAWSELMAALGYENYFAQGGDWGSAITTRLARRDSGCKGIHLNLVSAAPGPGQAENPTPFEEQSLADMEYYRAWDSGYNKQQATRPQTVGYSLVDSPVGLLAWIWEKFHAWTDCDGDPENALSRDEMLDNIMVYWVNAAGASAARLYWEGHHDDDAAGAVHTPTGATIFPREIVRSSRRWAENTYKDIRYWEEVEKGGHFAAFEQPELFVEELRRCFARMELAS